MQDETYHIPNFGRGPSENQSNFLAGAAFQIICSELPSLEDSWGRGCSKSSDGGYDSDGELHLGK
jgi:hypothetical protein